MTRKMARPGRGRGKAKAAEEAKAAEPAEEQKEEEQQVETIPQEEEERAEEQKEAELQKKDVPAVDPKELKLAEISVNSNKQKKLQAKATAELDAVRRNFLNKT